MADREKQWEQIQIKGFTAWINNSYLNSRQMPVQNIQTDLTTGVRLCTFAEIIRDRVPELNKAKLQRWEKSPSIRLHYIENVNTAIRFIKEDLKVKLVAIGAEDIVDGNIKYILGLLWSVFRKLRDMQLGTDENSSQKEQEQALLNWVKKMTEGYRDVEIKGFKDSWSDGMALNALVHRFDPSLINYDALDKSNRETNIKQAMGVAEKALGIPQLLEAEDLMKNTPDERSVVFYISLFFHAFVADAERRAIIEARTRSEKTAEDMQARLKAEAEARAAQERAARELEAKLRALQKEIDDLKKRLHLEHLLHLDDKGFLEEKIQALKGLLDDTSLSAAEKEERAKRLRAELEEAFRAREELERLKAQLEAEGSDLLAALREAEEAKKRLRAEIDELKRRVQQELDRRARKARAAIELERENAALKRQALVQGKARSGLEVLKKNLEEHLEDMYKWRELHQLDQDAQAPEVFDLQKVVDELQKKNFEEQLDSLNSKLQSENRNLQRIIRMKDVQQEINETVDKQGWLEVKGAAKSKDWKRQWFVLRGANLTFFKSEDADRAAGTIPLADAQVVSVPAEDDHKFVVGLKVEDKTVLLAAASEKEIGEWIAVINGEIVHLSYLRSIEKDAKHRPDTRLVNIFKSATVSSVYLDNHPLHAEELSALALTAQKRNLETVSLNNAGLTDAEADALANALGAMSFQVLKLSGNKFTDAGAQKLAAVLANNGRLQELHLDGNAIGNAGAQALAGLLGRGKLSALNLNGNKIGDAGAAAVAQATGASSVAIRELYLAENQVGDAGAAAIAQLIKGSSSLAQVHLQSNKIGDSGAAALADALAGNDSVSGVDLSENQIGNAGAVAIQGALKASKSLNNVNLSKNKGIVGGPQLAAFLGEGFVFPALSFNRVNPV